MLIRVCSPLLFRRQTLPQIEFRSQIGDKLIRLLRGFRIIEVVENGDLLIRQALQKTFIYSGCGKAAGGVGKVLLLHGLWIPVDVVVSDIPIFHKARLGRPERKRPLFGLDLLVALPGAIVPAPLREVRILPELKIIGVPLLRIPFPL